MTNYCTYFCRRRARFKSEFGDVNIPYGYKLMAKDNVLIYKMKFLCRATSQNGIDYFVQNDDNLGEQRAKLVNYILKHLELRPGRKIENLKRYWTALYNDEKALSFRRPDLEVWIWKPEFYNASIEDLEYIKNLIQ